MIKAYINNPKTNQSSWFQFPLYFGKLIKIGHSGSYDELLTIKMIKGTENQEFLGECTLHDLEKLNQLAERKT
ncbi:hypothetical protein ACR3IL_10560 [Streptococcus iniae]|nr:hypothetical protein BKX95_11580 [Streptococcus iniae]